MAYEIKLIIGRPTSARMRLIEQDDGSLLSVGRTFFHVVAELDLGCLSEAHHINKMFKKNTNKLSEYYWYGYDNDLQISQDSYGNRPELGSIGAYIKAIKKDLESPEPYRTLYWALALLESMKGSELSVLWYGD